MKAILSYYTTTFGYTIEDGPIIGSSPMRLRQGKFRVEMMTLTYHNSKLIRAFVRGQNILPDGSTGKIKMDRTLLVSEFPDWLVEFIKDHEDTLND